jgi:hypothetical protein
MAAADVPTFRDPWPSAQGTWAYPPWHLSGRVVTAWFPLPRPMVARMLSPDLMADGDELRVRLRFYDLAFAAAGPPREAAPVLADGRFLEAALGVPSRLGDIEADTSVSLWTDSFTYAMWGREAFGWPILPARVDLAGDVWSGPLEPGATGSASVEDEFGAARLTDIRIAEQTEPATGTPTWITPRRVPEFTPERRERREVLIVRPRVLNPGTRYLGSGTVAFAFPDGHPYAVDGTLIAQLDAVDGIELLVADDVTCVGSPAAT